MRPTLLGSAGRRGLAPIVLAALLCISGAQTAQAVSSAHFVESVFAEGFEPADVSGLSPQWTIDSVLDVLPAAQVNSGGPIDPGLAVAYSIEPCLLLAGSGTCQPSLNVGDGPSYKFIAEITIEAIQVASPEDGVLFFLSGLAPDPPYSNDDVALIFDQAPHDGFTFDPVDLITIQNGPQTLNYLGFFLAQDDVGKKFTVELEIDAAMLAGGTPVIYTNAADDFTLVPEPGTAILVGVGLIGVALRRRSAAA